MALDEQMTEGETHCPCGWRLPVSWICQFDIEIDIDGCEEATVALSCPVCDAQFTQQVFICIKTEDQ